MVLRNFVTLEEGVPAVLHFSRADRLEREIVDPLTGREKTVTVLDFTVDTLNGQETNATFSVTSEKLAQQLWPFVERGQVSDFNFIIRKDGRGFRTEYEVQAMPR